MLCYIATLTTGVKKQSSATLGNDPKYVRRRHNKSLQGHTDTWS